MEKLQPGDIITLKDVDSTEELIYCSESDPYEFTNVLGREYSFPRIVVINAEGVVQERFYKRAEIKKL